jgi:acetylglutamate kinase
MRVIKIGGRVQSDAALVPALAAAWVRDTALVVMHGGGDEVTALQRAFGRESRFVAGRRVTELHDLELLRMALSGSANKRLVAGLVGAGVPAVGLSGEDAATICARADERETMGEVGTSASVDSRLLLHLLRGGFCPILSPLARDIASKGAGVLNVNGDDAAAAVAVSLEAEELLLISDVDGVLMDGVAVRQLDAVTAREAIRAKVAQGGMAAKLLAGLGAVERGVAQVRIGSLAAIADSTAGTSLTLSRVLA